MIMAMRTCLTNVEDIVNKHSPSALSSTPPASRRNSLLTAGGGTRSRVGSPVSVSIQSATPTNEEEDPITTSRSSEKPGKPALPPKPSRMHNKPAVPPKPARSSASSRPTSPVVTPNHTGSTITSQPAQSSLTENATAVVVEGKNNII